MCQKKSSVENEVWGKGSERINPGSSGLLALSKPVVVSVGERQESLAQSEDALVEVKIVPIHGRLPCVSHFAYNYLI